MSITRSGHRRDERHLRRDLGFDVHGAVIGIALVTIAAVLGTCGAELFARPMTAAVLLRGPWLVIAVALSCGALALSHLIFRHRQQGSAVASTAVATLADADVLAGALLARSSLADSVWHEWAGRPLAALIYATSRGGSREAPARAAALSLAVCDPHNDAAWSEFVEVILRADIHLSREVYPVACLDGYQRASVGVVMHGAVLLWGQMQR